MRPSKQKGVGYIRVRNKKTWGSGSDELGGRDVKG